MRKSLPMSALLTGLLAAPVLGGTAAPVKPASAPVVSTVPGNAFPMTMPAAVADRMRRWARGESLDVGGMQDLQRTMMVGVQERIAAAMQERAGPARLWPVQAQGTPPVQTRQGMAVAQPMPAMEKAAYLGLAASSVSDQVREQLKLARGMGLVVDFVEAGSPAAAAGLQVQDVLQKVDDQWLVNPHQFVVLVRNKKPGERIVLTVLRNGQPATAQVTLVEREVAVLEQWQMENVRLTSNGQTMTADSMQLNMNSPRPAWNAVRPQGNMAGMQVGDVQMRGQVVVQNESRVSVSTNSDGSSTRKMMDNQHDITLTRSAQGVETLVVKDRAGTAVYEGRAENATLSPELAAKVADLRARSGEVRINIGMAGQGVAGTARTLTMTRDDGQHVISLKMEGTGRRVNVKDAGGKTLFDGPADSEADLKALAPEIAEKVRMMMEKVK